MDRLSPEVISLIIDNFGPGTSLAPYATVSRAWQHEIERRTFAYLKVTSDKVSTFRTAFANPNQSRRASVRALELVVCLHYLSLTKHDWSMNQAAFRKGATAVLEELAKWDEDDAAAKTPTPGSFQLVLLLRWHPGFGTNVDIERSPAWLRYFKLSKEDLERIPRSVGRVTAFKVRAMKGRALHPTTSCQLASRMPRLETFDVEYSDPPASRRDLRKAHHSAMAEGLRMLRGSQLPHLKELAIQREGAASPGNHSFKCQDFTAGQPGGVDELCEAIRDLVQEKSIQKLELQRVPLSSDLFYDRRKQASPLPSPSPLWPSLKDLSISSGIVGANGAWLFTGRAQDAPQWYQNPYDDAIVFDGPSDSDSDDDGGSKSEDDDYDIGYPFSNGEAPQHFWRTRPDHETFDPIVRDLSVAVKRMPMLQAAYFLVRRDLEGGIRVRFSGPERPFFKLIRPRDIREAEKNPRKRRVRVSVAASTEWKPPTDILKAWREWAGEDGEVRINDENSG